MGYDLVMPKDGPGGVNHLYQAAREANAKGQDPLAASKAAAEKDGVVNEAETDFLNRLQADPKLLDRMSEGKDEIVIKDVLNNNSVATEPKASPNISFVDNKDALKEAKSNFTKELGTKGDYVSANDPKLLGKLKGLADQLDPKAREDLISKVRERALGCAKTDDDKESLPLYAENRTKDFMYALDKAKEGKKLSTDDIQSVQLFIMLDTDHGKLLSEKGGDAGVDGKFGPRTNCALNNVFSELKK